MCDVNGPFKLCTCGTNVDRTKPHWILHRYIQSKEEYKMMGDFRTPDPYHQISTRSLKRRLNSVNVFDFDYVPVEGDYLATQQITWNHYLDFIPSTSVSSGTKSPSSEKQSVAKTVRRSHDKNLKNK